MKNSFFFLTACLLIIGVTGFGQQEQVSFKKTVVTNDFVAEGCAVGDVNKDGRPDIMAGSFWFESPSWKRHEIAPPEIFKPTEYSNSFLQFSMDVNQDGWIDLVRVGYPGEAATWYENPKNKTQAWNVHSLYHSVGNESPALFDINNDGRKDLVCADSKNKKVVWVSPPAKGDTVWKEYVISNDSARATFKYTHGLGFGDMNMDGRIDVIYREGWWEAPVDRTQPDWKFHPAALGDECAHMYVRDVDGDGDQDVISSSAHRYGIWWHEQVKEADSTRWVQHDIFNRFSQTHGLMMADINGDGNEDLVTGKRYYAHNGKDPGAEEPAVLYWFEYKPGKNPSWVPHLVDDNSGAGLNFIVQDINNDKRPDIIISNKKGVFVFEQVTSAPGFTTTRSAEGIELLENGKKVLFYQARPKSVGGKFERAGYIHPLYSLNGNSITDDSPADHPYHRGVFWAWHQIILNNKRLAEGWTSENISWVPVDVKVKRKREAATLLAKVLWKSKLENGRPIDIIKEFTTVKVYAATAQYRVIDFDIRLNALTDSLKIGGSEDAKGYGGFCIRLKLPKDISFISGDTVIPQETPVTARPWIDITGSFEGASLPKSGVIIFANSLNRPQPWILRSVTSMQNVPFPGTVPIYLPRTGIELKYRVIIHNGEMSRAGVEKLYQDYVQQNGS